MHQSHTLPIVRVRQSRIEAFRLRESVRLPNECCLRPPVQSARYMKVSANQIAPVAREKMYGTLSHRQPDTEWRTLRGWFLCLPHAGLTYRSVALPRNVPIPI